MSKLEELRASIAELAHVVQARRQEGGNPKTELQWDEIEQRFQTLVEQKVAEQVQARLDSEPQRRIPGEGIFAGRDVQIKNNRYASFIKSFAQGQPHRSGGQVFQPVDLWIAKTILEGQVKAQHARLNAGGSRPLPPSDELQAAIKALTSTGAGTGDELVPTNMAAQLWEDFFLASRVAGAVTRVPMPTNPFDIPLGLGGVTWRKGAENTATTASDPATAKSTLTATELVTEQNWSYTLDEDAAIAMAPAIRARLAQSGAEIIDSFMLNADSTNAATGNINSDDADPADDSYYLSNGQDGIIHQWLVDNTAQGVNAGGDQLVDGDIVAMLTKMGKYAVDPAQLVMVTDAKTYLNGFLALDGTLTADKFGPGAVLLTGQLAAYRGIPIVVSASHGLAEADGKQSATGSNNTLGRISCFHRMMWYAGFVRDLLIEVDRDIQKRQYIMVTSLREAVAAHGTRNANTHSAGVYNISLA